MTLSKAFDGSALLAALKSSSLADAPKAVGDLFSIVLGWVASSLLLLVSSNPLLAILAGFVPTVVSYLVTALDPLLPNLSITPVSLVMTKAFDLQVLLSALKTSEVPDLEQIVADDVAVLFDWVSSSLAMGNALEKALAPLAASLAGLVNVELAKLEALI